MLVVIGYSRQQVRLALTAALYSLLSANWDNLLYSVYIVTTFVRVLLDFIP